MSKRARQVLFAGVFVVVGLALSFGVAMTSVAPGGAGALPFAVVLAIVVCGIGVWLGVRTPSSVSASPSVHELAELDEPSPDDAGAASPHPYRGAPVPVAPPKKVSTRATVLLVLSCMSFTAMALPFAVHLPRWIEAEVVLGAWWTTWAVILGVLAYRGQALDETHELELRMPFSDSVSTSTPSAKSSTSSKRRTRWFDWLDLGNVADVEGCLYVIVAILVVGVALAAAWVVVELAAPALFFLAYVGIARSLRRALAASHRGNALRSGFHGALWATAYVAPLAAVVAITHSIR